jgi:hypothetical protein
MRTADFRDKRVDGLRWRDYLRNAFRGLSIRNPHSSIRNDYCCLVTVISLSTWLSTE